MELITEICSCFDRIIIVVEPCQLVKYKALGYRLCFKLLIGFEIVLIRCVSDSEGHVKDIVVIMLRRA